MLRVHKSMALLQILFLLTFTGRMIWAQSCQAGSIEGRGESITEALESGTVYVNVADSAECNGVVYGWHVCVPAGSITDIPSEVVIAMYDVFDNGISMVDGSHTELSVDIEDMYYYDYGVECLDHMLEPSEYFRVKEGTLVAACWEDIDTGLDMAVEYEDKLLRWVSTGSCSEENMGFLTGFGRVRDATLLLTAYINVDECLLGESKCHENATCTDVAGGEDSYNCTCNTGFTGDGSSCVDSGAGDNEGATEISERTDIEGSSSGDDRSTVASSGGSTASKPKGSREEQGNGAVVVAAVAAFIVVLLIIAVVAVLIMLYLSRHRIERALGTSIGSAFRRDSTKKRSDTVSTEASDDLHDYDYVVVVPWKQHGDDQYEMVVIENRTPLPALSQQQHTSVAARSTEYEVPILSLPNSRHGNGFDQPPQNSPQYEIMLSTPSVQLEQGEKDTGYAVPANGSAYATLLQRSVQEHIYESLSRYQVPASRQESLYAQLGSYHIRTISRENIAVFSKLGTGQFGKVCKAVWTEGGEETEVAVKTLTDSANTVKFLQEAAIISQFRHPNILTLHGVVSAGHPKLLVFELMKNGELKSVVTRMRPTPEQPVVEDTPLKLLDFSKQVALGLHYLSCRGFVHRDLAARNILVTEDYICKIADFGLSRDLGVTDDDIYVSRGGKIPLKWTAPEAMLRRKYSTASDVWSFGCLLYEIWSLGHKPFETHQNTQVVDFVKKGYRLPPPPGCPKKIYRLMIDSWHPDASSRPQPRDVLKGLLGNVDEVLAIPAKDVPAGSQAAILGAPLDRGNLLYQDLQNTYKLT